MQIPASHPSVAWLLSCWQGIAQAEGDLPVIHRWLLVHPPQAPLDQLLSALPVAADAWLQAYPANPGLATRVMATFGTVMQQCPLTDPVAQIELAIAIYSLTLDHITPTADPSDWATTINNLATAYRHRRQGNRADNLEKAIHLYRQARAIQTPDNTLWPVTLTGLGMAYEQRTIGDPDENLEQAIAAYEQALPMIPANTPAWSWVLNRLAAAYSDRQRGDRQTNITMAIKTYQQALVGSAVRPT